MLQKFILKNLKMSTIQKKKEKLLEIYLLKYLKKKQEKLKISNF